MSELTRLTDSRRRYAKEWKITVWTLGIAFAVYLVTDGKTTSAHPIQHLLLGAVLGLVLGYFFSRNVKGRGSSK
jgi:hypothetical protein